MSRTVVSKRLPAAPHRLIATTRTTACAVVVICVVTAGPPVVSVAAEPSPPGPWADPPIYTAPHVGARDESAAVSGSGVPRGAIAGANIPDSRGPAALPPPRASAALIELPGDYRPRNGNSRPHHAIGFRSTAAENWLREQGVDARQCYLPMLRARARMTPSGDASAALWIYARCSIN